MELQPKFLKKHDFTDFFFLSKYIEIIDTINFHPLLLSYDEIYWVVCFNYISWPLSSRCVGIIVRSAYAIWRLVPLLIFETQMEKVKVWIFRLESDDKTDSMNEEAI